MDVRDEEIKNLRAELGAQRKLNTATSGQQQQAPAPAKDEWQYIQLPDGSYQQFPAGMADAEIVARVKKAYPEALVPKPVEQVTSGQVLAEENRPLTKGLEAANQSASKGVLGTLAAPGVGFGEAAGTATQNILANIPGLGGAGGVVPAAGAALANAGGNLLVDQLVGGAIGKGIKAVTKLPEAISTITKAGKYGKIATQLEQPATFGEQVATPLSNKVSALYKVAEAQAPVPSKAISDYAFNSILNESRMANKNPKVISTLEGLYNKFAKNGQAAYSDVLQEVQRLRLTARGFAEKQPQAAKALNDTAEGIMQVLDSSSTAARQAGALARKNIFGKEVLDTLLRPNAGTKVRQMLLDEPRNAQAIGLTSPQKVEEFVKLVDKYAKPVSVNADTLKKIAIGSAGYYGLHKLYRSIFGGSGSGFGE